MKLTQKQRVMKILRDEGEISNLFAIQNNIWRLGAVIHDIRNMEGWEIKTKMEGRVAHYKLVKSPKRVVGVEEVIVDGQTMVRLVYG